MYAFIDERVKEEDRQNKKIKAAKGSRKGGRRSGRRRRR